MLAQSGVYKIVTKFNQRISSRSWSNTKLIGKKILRFCSRKKRTYKSPDSTYSINININTVSVSVATSQKLDLLL